MTLRNKIIAALGALLFYGLWAVDRLDTINKLIEAPGTALTTMRVVRRMFDLTQAGWVILILGTACLLVSTSDWWRPWFSRLAVFYNANSPKGRAQGTAIAATTTPPTQPSHPISYVELAQYAVDNLGWDFNDNWQEYDFAHAIAHGCNYGHVELDGKPADASENYKSMYLPVPIKKSAWRENTLKIWVDKKANVPLNKADNWDVIVASLGGTLRYRDPQVLDPLKAMAWLKSGGAKYKGEFKASHDAQQERKRARWPDFKPWDAKDKFELYEAACLWFLLDPVLPMPDRPKALYQDWKAAIENGGMPALFTDDGLDNAIMSGIAKRGSAVGIEDGKPLVTPHTKVVREVLVGWAEHHNEKPLFLFPEERGN